LRRRATAWLMMQHGHVCPPASDASGSQRLFTRGQLSLDVEQVAVRLLGATLSRTDHAGTVAVRITEVEAYGGVGEDAASHAHRGVTPRNKAMFETAGLLYVYFVYGMHWCVNVVCGPTGVGSAVLVRAGEVVAGEELARRRRPTARSAVDLARGPGNLSSALGVTGVDGGSDLLSGSSAVQLWQSDTPTPRKAIANGSRVGIRHEADRPWRWWLSTSSSVSRVRKPAPNTPR